MNDAQLLQIVKKIPKQIVGILISNELVTLKNKTGPYTFTNCEIAKNVTLDSPFSEEEITQLRNCFPANFKGVYEHFVKKLFRFNILHPEYTFEQIHSAFIYWNERQLPPYCGKADNFIELEQNGSKGSRLYETLQILYNGPDTAMEVKVYS